MKPIRFMGSSDKDLAEFPEEARREAAFALDSARLGSKHHAAKPLQGFGNAQVLEIVCDADGDTYRAVYTVQFRGAIYVLHAFQKRSTKGKATPQRHIDLIKKRLKAAAADHERREREERAR